MRKYVLNSLGEKEPFSLRKVYQSALRAGASKKLALRIAQKIKKEIPQNTQTSEIFEKVRKALLKEDPASALRYNLKKAMLKLGPSGFPFEKFIGEVLKSNGFEVKLNQYLLSGCQIKYEIDFLAQKGKLIYIGECKYHWRKGEKVDLKVALENWARFLDLKNSSFFRKLEKENFQIKPMIVTNAKFSQNAIKFSRCLKMELLGWRYPEDKGLEFLIESKGLYPITILTSFKSSFKEIFSKKGMMLAKDLLKEDEKVLAKKLKLPLKEILPLIKEAKILFS